MANVPLCFSHVPFSALISFFTRAEKQTLIRDMTVRIFRVMSSKFIEILSILYNKLI